MNKVAYFCYRCRWNVNGQGIHMGVSGEVCKAFDIKDWYGIYNILIPPNRICAVVITGRKSKIVEKRCDEVGIEQIYQNVRVKKVKEAGEIIGCPTDAIKEVVEMADFISTKDGGNGVV